MRIREEALRVVDDLLDLEARSIVDAGSVVRSDEERASQAAIRDTEVIRSFRVGECETRRASLALHGLVDMGCSDGRGAVIASDTGERDVLFDWSGP
jgi:hypothetical protein